MTQNRRPFFQERIHQLPGRWSKSWWCWMVCCVMRHSKWINNCIWQGFSHEAVPIFHFQLFSVVRDIPYPRDWNCHPKTSRTTSYTCYKIIYSFEAEQIIFVYSLSGPFFELKSEKYTMRNELFVEVIVLDWRIAYGSFSTEKTFFLLEGIKSILLLRVGQKNPLV